MPITSHTSTGVKVTLTGGTYLDRPQVEVRFTHPALGLVVLGAGPQSWSKEKGQEGICGQWGGRRICVTVPRADWDAALVEAMGADAAELEALKSGRTPIRLTYHDGEYLSGHEASGRAADLLAELGLATYTSGWGYHVADEVVRALGTEFIYPQAVEYSRPACEAAAAKRRERQRATDARMFEALTEAARTQQPVVVRTWGEPCDGSVRECDYDSVSLVMLPDGTTRTERRHSH